MLPETYNSSHTAGSGVGEGRPLRQQKPSADAKKLGHYLLLTAVLGAAGLVYLLGNDQTALWDRDEPRFAQASREMIEGQDFIVPYFNGQYRFDKPVLIYWLMTVNYGIFGVGDFGARFGSSLSGVLACVLMYVLGRGLFNRRVGLWAAAILASYPLFMVESKLATADALLAVFLVASLGLWLVIRGGRQQWYYAVLLGLAVGLGTLTKGPVIWLFLWAGSMATIFLQIRRGSLWVGGLAVLSVVGLAVVYFWPGPPAEVRTAEERLQLLAWLDAGLVLLAVPVAGAIGLGRADGKGLARRTLKAFGLVLLGMAVAGALFAPWGLAALSQTDGSYWTEGVGRHVLQRSAESLEGHWGPPGYYLAGWMVCAFPWSALGPVVIWQSWRVRRLDGRIAGLLGWVIGPWLVLEAVQTKLVHYALGCYPAMALLTAVLLYRWRAKLSRKHTAKTVGRMGLSALWIIGVAVALVMVVAVGLLSVGPLAELSETDKPRYELLLAAGLAGLTVIGTGLAVRGSLLRGRSGAAVVCGFVGVMVWGAMVGGWLAPGIADYRISRRAAGVAKGLSPAGTQFVLFGFDEPSVIWYLRGKGQEGLAFGNRKVVIVSSAEEFRSRFEGNRRICALVSRRKMNDLIAGGFEFPVAYRWVEGLYLGKMQKAEMWVGLNKSPVNSGANRAGGRE